MSPLVRARSWVAKKDNQPSSTKSSKGATTFISPSSNSNTSNNSSSLIKSVSGNSSVSKSLRPINSCTGNVISQSRTPTSSPIHSSSVLPSTSNSIPAEKLQEILLRHQIEIALVKQEARELKQDKAFLVAQNLRLERELCAHNRTGSSNSITLPVSDQRRLIAPNRRPSFNRSRTQPLVDLNDNLSSFSLRSPSHSTSSSSSHHWPCCSSGEGSTPSSSSASIHSRNPSTASLAALSVHGTQNLSRRPSLSSCTGGHAIDPSILTPNHAALHSRLQRLAHASGLGISSIRPLSATGCPRSEDLDRNSSPISNPSSATPSRRNSMTGGIHHTNDVQLALKGILKTPSTASVRPLSSCAARSNEAFQRRISGLGYYVEDGYDSITKTLPPNNNWQSAHSNQGSSSIRSGYQQNHFNFHNNKNTSQHHSHTQTKFCSNLNSFPVQRNRRSSLDFGIGCNR
ncbi:hypothetical protein BY996DRAFT_7502028 [Phakopsora pachyrhizi]|uniref:Uncharacterized protein n=1 Tax=Phakopsora pachyrhizi TaxID=170000 RepID=A0AAV0BTS5_PHAPC|nr:hypothetical protein BY996DRAFT_7502028 [Phakopsora pachyrhizi]CAH7690932.1 hypothetical protein PPACK8108_LOCUS26421 [Phakopsora pachyrhizi]